MSRILGYLSDRLTPTFRDDRGLVSVEWIILAIVVMVAIVVAFKPTFQTALSQGVSSVASVLQAQATSGAGS